MIDAADAVAGVADSADAADVYASSTNASAADYAAPDTADAYNTAAAAVEQMRRWSDGQTSRWTDDDFDIYADADTDADAADANAELMLMMILMLIG